MGGVWPKKGFAFVRVHSLHSLILCSPTHCQLQLTSVIYSRWTEFSVQHSCHSLCILRHFLSWGTRGYFLFPTVTRTLLLWAQLSRPCTGFCLQQCCIYYLVIILSLCFVFQVKSTPLPNGLVQDEFEKTSVNMSTYLVAFIVADFTPISKNVSETLVDTTMSAFCFQCRLYICIFFI